MIRKDPFAYSGFTKDNVTVPAYGTATVEYSDVTPNYFRVQNVGTSQILAGTSVMPSKKRYDFAIGGEAVKMYAEPNKRSRLYLLNQSGTDVECVVVAFEAPFDPLILALSEISLSLDTSSMTISQEISGFKASLPAGTNNIGKVEVSNLTNYAGTLAEILTAIGNIGSSSAWTADDVSSLLARVYHPAKESLRRDQMHTYTQAGTATSTGTTLTPQTGRFFSKINFLSNDGESDLNFIYTDKNATKSITIKAGEVLNDLECYFTQIKFTGNNVPFRCLYTTELTTITV